MMRLRPTALSAALLLGAAALASCGEDAVQDILAPLPGARVKFFNFGVNTPSLNFYANDRKMTAIQSTTCATPSTNAACLTTGAEATTGTAPGQAGANGLYTAIAPGQYTLSGRISAAADKDLPIATASATIADGKAYSYYVSGIYDAAAKKADAFVVEDSLPSELTDFSVAWVRFVNAVPNASGPLVATVTIEAGGQGAVGGATAYKTATGFRVVPNGLYTIAVTAQGASTPLVTRTGVNLVGGRVYTLAVRGDATLPSTGTSANRPQIDVTANR
jgi:hypothetical protein